MRIERSLVLSPTNNKQDSLSVKKQQRAELIRVRLDDLYPETPIPLDHSDEFTLLVAVVLSAQCTDKKVNEVTPKLFQLAGSPKSMKNLGEQKILDIIRPLGLSKQKAKNLSRLAEIIVDQFNGEVPRTFEELESLPGVGHKTASVVMSQAFGVPAFPVDTHIHRLAQRWGLSSGKNVAQTERDLKRAVSRETLGTNSICRSFSMVASFAQPADATGRNAISAANCIRIATNRSNGKSRSVCYLNPGSIRLGAWTAG